MDNVHKLPDVYLKDTLGNNYKLLHLNELAIADFKHDIEDVLLCLDIEQSYGRTLDLYGDMLQQKRGQLNDIQYIYLLLNRIGRNTTLSDYNSILKQLAKMFKCKTSDLYIKDTDVPCVVELYKFPLVALIQSEFSSTQAVQLIQLLLPVGITLETSDFVFEGTFEFSSTDTEYEEEKGFGNIEQTIGGWFGLLLSPEDKFVLPII